VAFRRARRGIVSRQVQVYTKYRVGTPRPRRRRGKRVLVFVLAMLLAGVAWLGSTQGWWRREPFATSNPTNELQFSVNAPSNGLASASERVPAAVGRVESGPTNSHSSAAQSEAILEAQIALDRLAISPGSIDGVLGSQTRAAIRAFQSRESLPRTGELDGATSARLTLAASTFAKYRVEAGDIARLCPLAATWLGKSQQERLDYETPLELVAERSHAHPNLIQRLNGAVEWAAVRSGAEIIVPAIERETPRAKAAFVRIRLGERTLQAFDSTNGLLAHFPCSIARRVEKRPVGELRVTVLVPNPDYMFNPDIFPESTEAQELAGRKLHIKPGPNNPVGTAWIGLNLSGYGIHGTPKPEDVGRTESHGCFRLANWNAEYLLQLVAVGTPVRVEP